MRAVSPIAFPGSPDELRRRLLEGFSGPLSAPQTPRGSRSPGLRVLVDGFLQGSLLTLAVCTPKRESLFTSQTAKREKPFRTYIVSSGRRVNAVPAPTAKGPAETAPTVR
jgi:hypothetical protein